MTTNRVRAAAALLLLSAAGSGCACTPQPAPEPQLIPPLCMERDANGVPQEVPCLPTPECFIVDQPVVAFTIDREVPEYLTWRYEDDGSVIGFTLQEDDPSIWNTPECAMSDGDSGL